MDLIRNSPEVSGATGCALSLLDWQRRGCLLAHSQRRLARNARTRIIRRSHRGIDRLTIGTPSGCGDAQGRACKRPVEHKRADQELGDSSPGNRGRVALPSGNRRVGVRPIVCWLAVDLDCADLDAIGI